jgi:hypothetical protein
MVRRQMQKTRRGHRLTLLFRNAQKKPRAPEQQPVMCFDGINQIVAVDIEGLFQFDRKGKFYEKAYNPDSVSLNRRLCRN